MKGADWLWNALKFFGLIEKRFLLEAAKIPGLQSEASSCRARLSQGWFQRRVKRLRFIVFGLIKLPRWKRLLGFLSAPIMYFITSEDMNFYFFFGTFPRPNFK